MLILWRLALCFVALKINSQHKTWPIAGILNMFVLLVFNLYDSEIVFDESL